MSHELNPETRACAEPLGLGLDVGGTGTRWALARGAGEILAEGEGPGFSALDLTGESQGRLAALLADLAKRILVFGRPLRVHAGLTGFGEGQGPLARLIAAPLGLAEGAVRLSSDIETAYLDLFAPGQGYMVYAGTGSVAAFIDAEGVLQRAGGRGVLIDDGGGGYWIAREALRRVWRAEDERPGCWQESPLARELFALLGGPDWARSRRYVYGGTRGDIGRLALGVARAAATDPEAEAILRRAGEELARLALALIGRYGPRPVALSGRAATLHPLIAATLGKALPEGLGFALRVSQGEHAAARLALRSAQNDLLPFPKET